MYTIDSRPDTVIPDNSRALIRDAHGVLVAATYGEHCEQTAQTIIVALTNPDLYDTIQQQAAELKQLRPAAERAERLEKQLAEARETDRRGTNELLRLNGLVTQRDITIAQLRATVRALDTQCAEGKALAQYVTEGE